MIYFKLIIYMRGYKVFKHSITKASDLTLFQKSYFWYVMVMIFHTLLQQAMRGWMCNVESVFLWYLEQTRSSFFVQILNISNSQAKAFMLYGIKSCIVICLERAIKYIYLMKRCNILWCTILIHVLVRMYLENMSQESVIYILKMVI